MRFLRYSLLLEVFLNVFDANPVGETLVLNVIFIVSHSACCLALPILLVNSLQTFLRMFFYMYVSCKSFFI